MEFWGVEVKSGETVKVMPDEGSVILVSNAALGDPKGKGEGFVTLRVKIEGSSMVLGYLSEENIPQISFDLVFDKEFELSHDSKHGSVHFIGTKTKLDGPFSDSGDDSDNDSWPDYDDFGDDYENFEDDIIESYWAWKKDEDSGTCSEDGTKSIVPHAMELEIKESDDDSKTNLDDDSCPDNDDFVDDYENFEDDIIESYWAWKKDEDSGTSSDDATKSIVPHVVEPEIKESDDDSKTNPDDDDEDDDGDDDDDSGTNMEDGNESIVMEGESDDDDSETNMEDGNESIVMEEESDDDDVHPEDESEDEETPPKEIKRRKTCPDSVSAILSSIQSTNFGTPQDGGLHWRKSRFQEPSFRA